MRKTLFAALAFVMMVGAAIVLPLSTAQAVETFLLETETRLYRPDKTYPGYFMVQPSANNNATASYYLLDPLGNLVHQINNAYGQPRYQPDGTIWSGGRIQDWDSNVLWNYNPAADSGRATTTIHHDWQRMWNKKLNQWTMLLVVNRHRTQAEALATGADPSINYVPSAKCLTAPSTMTAAEGGTAACRTAGIDYLIEVDMNKNIVWEWDFYDHTVQSKNPSWPRYASDVKNAPGKMDVNWKTDNQQPNGLTGLTYDWAHVNSVDYNADTGHVVVNPKHFSQMFVIDHDKTFVSTTNLAANKAAAAGPDGDFIYRWGNPSSYNAGAAPSWLNEGETQGYGWHAIQYIRPYSWEIPRLPTDKWPDPATYPGTALPGAGQFLYFDNGCYNPTRIGSRIIQIDPRIGASGKPVSQSFSALVDPLVAGYGAITPPAGTVVFNSQRKMSKQQTWRYQTSSINSFNSSAQSYVQRLPNGNTFIWANQAVHAFEVTQGTGCTWATGGQLNCANQEVVWEYIWPGPPPNSKFVSSDSALAYQINDPRYYGQAGGYRAQKWGADFPGFAGKDLTPKGTLTGRVPQLVGEGRVMQTPPTGFGYSSTGITGSGGGAGGAGGAGGGGGGY